MWLDMVDETYLRPNTWSRDARKAMGHLKIYDSNTVGKDYLCIGTSQHEAISQPVAGEAFGHIRLHKGQVKTVIRALQRWIDYVEGGDHA